MTDEVGQGLVTEPSAGDDPITSAHEDQLARSPFASRLADAVLAVEGENSSCVFALIGPWGGGKTSVLNLARSSLSAKGATWDVVDFSPWMVTGLESLVSEFFAALESGLGGSDHDLKKRLGDIAGQLIPASTVLKLVGVDAAPALEAIKKGLAPTKTLASQHAELTTILESRKTPVLVVVDDLDRLHADELTLVFKLIRLVGRLPNIHYLIAFDEETIVDVLTGTDVAGDDPSRAREYLEKMVQYRFDLPSIHVSQAWRLFTAQLEAVMSRWEVSLADDDLKRFVECWSACMWRRLSTPRSIRRFVDHVESVWPLVKGETDFVDVLAIAFIRMHEPEVYKLVADERLGLTRNLGYNSPTSSPRPDVKTEWLDKLSKAGLGVQSPDELLGLLMILFPDFAARVGTSGVRSRYGDDDLSRAKRVGSAEYFDRYFHYGVVPEVDIPDTTVIEAITNSEFGPTSPAIEQLLRAAEVESTRVICKFTRLINEATRRDWGPVVVLAAQLYSSTPRSSGLLGSDTIILTSAVSGVVAEKNIANISDVIRQSSELDPSLRFVSDIASNLRSMSENPDSTLLPNPQSVDQVVSAVIEVVETRITSLARTPPGDDDEAVRLLRIRADLATDAEEVRNLAWSLVDDDTSTWTLESLLGQCVPIARAPMNDPAIENRHPGNVLSAIERLLGLDRVLSRCAPLGEPDDDLPQFDNDVSLPNRTRHALHVLATESKKTGPRSGGEPGEADSQS